MRAVNLLPRDEQRARLESARTPLLLVAGGVAAVTTASVLLVFSTSGTADQRRAELAEVEAAIAKMPRRPDPAVSEGALLQERTDRSVALAAALSTRVSFDQLLREISLVLPEDAWLTGFKAATPASLAPAGSPGTTSSAPSSSGLDGVTLQGATYSHSSVARVLARLSVVPSLENIRLTASARIESQTTQAEGPSGAGGPTSAKKTKQKTVVTFTITASLRTGGSS